MTLLGDTFNEQTLVETMKEPFRVACLRELSSHFPGLRLDEVEVIYRPGGPVEEVALDGDEPLGDMHVQTTTQQLSTLVLFVRKTYDAVGDPDILASGEIIAAGQMVAALLKNKAEAESRG